MARKKKAAEHENLERWLVSYADFITLLFAFFVVMYSISSVNEGKYRVLSDSLVAAFRAPTKTLQPIQVGQSSKSPLSSKFQIRQSPFAVTLPEMPLPWVKYRDSTSEEQLKEKSKGGAASESGSETGGPIDEMVKKLMEQGQLNITPGGKAAITEKLKEIIAGQAARGTANGAAAGQGLTDNQVVVMRKIASEVQQAMQKLIDEDLIAVRRSQLWVEVEIKASVLFASGDASVNTKAIPVLTELAKILKPFPNVIRVEGFTDNIPIRNNVYPSNWELSSARAASVVRLFVDHGIAPQRLLAVGYGKYHPIADNGTSAGRRKNRRVVLVVLATRAKTAEVESGLHAEDRGERKKAQSSYEDKGIQTPQESLPPVLDKATKVSAPEVTSPAAAPAAGTQEEAAPTTTSPLPPTAPNGPAAAPEQPHSGPSGLIRRPSGLSEERRSPQADALEVIPPPIRLRSPIDLVPPLPLQMPSTVLVAPPTPQLSPSSREKTP